MKKIFLTSGLVVCMACPAFADDTLINASTAGNCVVDVLGVSENLSTATLEAQWDAIISGKITLTSGRYASSSATSVDTDNPLTNTPTSTVYSKYDTGMFSDSTAQTPITTITKPTIAGYDFGGFYTTKSGATDLTGATGTKVINADGTFTDGAKNIISTTGGTAEWFAQWTPHTYTISYAKGNAGTRTGNAISGTTANTTATFDASATLATNGFNIDGYTFDKWVATKVLTTGADAPNGDGYPSGATISPYRVADNIELTATWTPNHYKVTYKCGLHGATGDGACADFVDQFNDSTQTGGATYDAAYTALTLAQATSIKVAPGYTFKEWNFEEAGTAATFTGIPAVWPDNALGAAQDKTVYAIYTANEYKLKYDCGTASYNGNPKPPHDVEGDAPADVAYDFDSTVSSLVNGAGTCAVTGYTFAGWSCDNNGTTVTSNAAGVITAFQWKEVGDIICTAQWTPNTITLNWDDKDATRFEDDGDPTCTYDGGINIPTQPEKTGYTFQGWKVKPATTGGEG